MKKTTLTAGELATTGPITPANGVDLLMGLSHTRTDTRRLERMRTAADIADS